MTPPHEHGRFSAKRIMYATYAVKNSIKINELRKPHLLKEGINNNAAVNNSKIGNIQDNIFALDPINGDSLKIALKVL